MKLTIKTLTQAIFKVDIEPEKSVKDLKETIEKEQGKEYPSGSQKLIYNGKILADENKLAEYEFDEKKFVVLMITKPPPPAKPASSTTETESKTTRPIARRSAQPSQGTTSSTSTATATTTPTVSSSPTTTATTPTAASDQTQSRTTQPSQPAATPLRGPALNNMAALSMGEQSEMANRLVSLMSQPHFREMQDMIQQNPHLMSSTIDSLANIDPDMYNFISENPELFLSALNHPPLPVSRAGAASSGQRQSSQARSGSQQAVGVQGGGVAQPVMDQLLGDGVSEHDKEAIERLKELGFSEYLAVQAYMACDKDEQLAANLLFQMDQ